MDLSSLRTRYRNGADPADVARHVLASCRTLQNTFISFASESQLKLFCADAEAIAPGDRCANGSRTTANEPMPWNRSRPTGRLIFLHVPQLWLTVQMCATAVAPVCAPVGAVDIESFAAVGAGRMRHDLRNDNPAAGQSLATAAKATSVCMQRSAMGFLFRSKGQH